VNEDSTSGPSGGEGSADNRDKPGEADIHELFRTLARLTTADCSERRRHALALVDVDELGTINADEGVTAGTRALLLVLRSMAGTLRHGEHAARWAGDQYVLLLPGIGRRAALRRTRRIVSVVNREAGLSVSAGVAIYPVDGRTSTELVDAAHVALRVAKQQGGACVRG
jgi:diguanylate cyclase (GGDEF)-like protein